METNRIDYLFGLNSKTATAKYADKDAGGKSRGFADLLVGAISQRADGLAVDHTQIKATASTTTASWRDGRGLPTSRVVTDRHEDRANPLSRHDRRIDRDRAASGTSDDAATKASAAPDNVAGSPVRTDHKHGACGKAGHSDQQVDDVAEGEPTDSSAQIDAATETESTDESHDTGIGSEGGESDGDSDAGKGDDSDQTPDQQNALALVTCAVPIDETPVTTEIGTAIVPQTNPVAGDAASAPSDIGEMAALAATAALPGIADIGDGGDVTAPVPGTEAEGQAATAQTGTAKPAITFAAVAALATGGDLDATDTEAQKAAVNADNEQLLEDTGNSFRRNGNSGRKTAPVGQGTAAGQHPGTQNSGQAAPDLHAAVTQNNVGTPTAGVPIVGSVAPLGFDGGLGAQSGLPGLSLHLGQAGAVRRGDFVANLRQHLQNLPVHDQVALTIQRSLRDGNGSITLQLSPTELGRIHVKLDIDEENNVQASVVVERPATLDLLQRDAKALERALQEAGLKAGPGDLSFSLQGGDAEAFARDFGSGSGTGSGGKGLAADNGVEDFAAGTASPVIATGDGWVDVQV